MKMTLLEITQDIPKSTQWARANKHKVAEAYKLRKGTLQGKLISLVTNSRYRCKKSKLPHDVDTAFLTLLYAMQDGKCALSGLPMTIIGSRGSDEYWHSMSLDRKDSNGGYTTDNVQLVCTGVNYMKKDMTDEMFLTFCKVVVENSL